MDNKNEIVEALSHPLYKNHEVGDTYTMDGEPDLWKIAYYPLFSDRKTGEVYKEPRALVENTNKPGFWNKKVPLRYLKPTK